MSPEELHQGKQMLGAILLDELQMRSQQEPNLLVDILLSENGYQFIAQTLQKRLAFNQHGVTVATVLMRALPDLVMSLRGTQRLEPAEREPEDKVA